MKIFTVNAMFILPGLLHSIVAEDNMDAAPIGPCPPGEEAPPPYPPPIVGSDEDGNVPPTPCPESHSVEKDEDEKVPATPCPTSHSEAVESHPVSQDDNTQVKPKKNCEVAMDDNKYCLCPKPQTGSEDRFEVSVCGDSTYLLPSGVRPCSGPISKESNGSACPKKGDVAIKNCRSNIISYLTGKTLGRDGDCVAPEDASCVKLNTGAWGCVFPGNCNSVNKCLEKPICNEEYEKDEDGECKLHENGYVVQSEKSTSLLSDTGSLEPLKTKYSASLSSTMTVSYILLSIVMSVISRFIN